LDSLALLVDAAIVPGGQATRFEVGADDDEFMLVFGAGVLGHELYRARRNAGGVGVHRPFLQTDVDGCGSTTVPVIPAIVIIVVVAACDAEREDGDGQEGNGGRAPDGCVR